MIERKINDVFELDGMILKCVPRADCSGCIAKNDFEMCSQKLPGWCGNGLVFQDVTPTTLTGDTTLNNEAPQFWC